LFYAQQFADAPMQYAEEPQSLEPRDHRLDMFRQDNGLRKDSVPFDPTSSSTLIASVAGGPHSNPGTPAHYHYEYAQQQQAYMQQQHAAMNAEAYSSATPSTGDWNNDMRQQQQEAARRASFNGGSLADPHLEELQRM
jgi:hypothetical protein